MKSGDFEVAWASRVVGQVDGVPIQVVGRQELIRSKRSSGRPQDLVDADALAGSPPAD